MLARKSSSSAASQQLHELPPSGERPAVKEAKQSANLPIWASTPDARALLALIIAEQPERNRPLTELATGQTASFGFAGKAANLLRAIYDQTFDRMLTFVGAVPFDSPEYHCRRNALIAFDKANNADAVIARAMEAAR